jgi:hypothetical protein
MTNPWAGEVRLVLDGVAHDLRLTLGALAELEHELDEGIVELIERFEAGRFATRDVLALIVAGLRGSGWKGSGADLLAVEIEGGLLEATRVAAQLLARGFGAMRE